MSLDIIDNDPIRLAARTLVERLRSEEYKEGDMLGAYGPVLDYVEAVEAVMDFFNTYSKKCDHKFIDSNHCLKCGWRPDGR